MTLFEVGVVIAVVMILLLLLPGLLRSKRKVSSVSCVANLKQIGLAYRIWESDNGDIYPMGISVTNGGSMEMAQMGNVALTFQVMSNELSTPKILLCPNDASRVFATMFAGLANSNISYFVGVDITNDMNPLLIISGDSNLQIGRKTAKSGLLSMWTNDPVAWDSTRHAHYGNIGLADGSVQSVTDPRLRDSLIQTGVATNRFAIP